jgi:hypothetical protein
MQLDNVIYLEKPVAYARGYSYCVLDGIFIMVKFNGFGERMIAKGEAK